MSDLSERLRRAAETCFGSASPSAVARFSDANYRRVQYWIKGESEPKPEVVEALEAAAEIVKRVGPDAAMDDLLARWIAAGMHPEVIASVLSRAHEKVTGRTIG